MTKPFGLILAGGQARRLGGGDKPLLAIGGRTILARILARLEAQCAPIAISANGDPARFAPFERAIVPDSVPGQAGPLAGVLAGMDAAADHGAQTLLTVSGDCPFLPRDLETRLARARKDQERPIARAGSGGRIHPTIALWPVSLREDLRAALRRHENKVHVFQDAHGCARTDWSDTPFDPFFNVNDPADVAAAERIANTWPQA